MHTTAATEQCKLATDEFSKGLLTKGQWQKHVALIEESAQPASKKHHVVVKSDSDVEVAASDDDDNNSAVILSEDN